MLLSALLSPHGWPDAIYRAWQKDRFDLVTAAAQIDGLRHAHESYRLVYEIDDSTTASATTRPT